MEQLHSFLVAELGSERTNWLPGSKPLIVQLLKYKDLLCAGAELSLVWADGPGNRWLQGCLWDVSWAEGSLGKEHPGGLPGRGSQQAEA